MIQKTVDFSIYGFLIVDDKPFLRNMVQSILLGCQVLNVKQASNGAEAMKVLATSPGIIDCVLCDWNMEPVDGLELLRSIRAGSVHNTPRDLRIIMLTGHADEHVVKTALAMDANGYVVKPVSTKKLIIAINKAFTSPTSLKPAATYKSTVTVDTPDSSRTPINRTPPWVLLLGMDKKERENFSNKIENIRRDAHVPLEHQAQLKRAVKRLDLASITPGMVLAEDIYADDGILLLASGRLLTKSLLGRLRDLLEGRSEEVWLMVVDFGD